MTLARTLFAPTRTTQIPLTAVGINLLSVSCLFVGFSLRETTGAAPADVDFVDGNDGNGEVFATLTLAAGQSVRDLVAPTGLLVDSGPFLRVNSGSVRGAFWWREIPRGYVELEYGDEL